MSERKHADLWKKLDDEAGEDEIDRAANVTVEQAEAELKAAGFDVAAERATASAFLDALDKGAPQSAPGAAPPSKARAADERRRVRPRPSVAWLAAAATVGGIAGGALVAALELPAVVLAPRPPVPSTSALVVLSAADLAAAADLRRHAGAACDAKQWSLCLADLDKARAADPGGDDAPAVKSLRDKAIAGILQKPEGPAP
jgi:hypothetical protein